MDIIKFVDFRIGIVVVDAINAFRQVVVVLILILGVGDIVRVNNIVSGEVNSVRSLDDEEDLLFRADCNV